MKTATLPPLRVDQELRDAVEQVLREGESLSAFLESTVRQAVQHRLAQSEFAVRADAAWAHYTRTGQSTPAGEVFDKIEATIDAKRRKLSGP